MLQFDDVYHWLNSLMMLYFWMLHSAYMNSTLLYKIKTIFVIIVPFG